MLGAYASTERYQACLGDRQVGDNMIPSAIIPQRCGGDQTGAEDVSYYAWITTLAIHALYKVGWMVEGWMVHEGERKERTRI